MPEKDDLETRSRWIREVFRRVGDHPFATNSVDGRPPLQRLLDSTYRLHFVDKHFSRVKPPLPYLPALPLDERWVELRLTEGADNLPYFRNRGLAELSANMSVARFLATTDSVIVLGEPGAGKSTMMKWSARYMISETRSQSIIPLYVSLGSYARWRASNSNGSILTYLAQQHALHGGQFADFIADVEIEASGGPMKAICRVLLDGWDEVPPLLRIDVRDDIYRIQHLIPIIVTSRPSGYVSSLHIDKRYEITPLSFESMRLLMREWFADAGKPELEIQLCHHLDRHLGFRELARNPFVLTLLCAITSRDRQRPIPDSQASLYSRLLDITRERCNSEFRTEGYAWTSRDLEGIHSAAFETLCDESGGCRYEFELDSIRPISPDGTRLIALLDRSRLITMTCEDSEQWSFLHSTVHEFLAARHLVHGATTELDALALRPEWLNVMIFACGLLPGEQDHPIWTSLREAAANLDRFGLIALRLATVLAGEVSCNDGGAALLGIDVRPELWRCFLESPIPRAYAIALMELDSDYALDHLNEIPVGSNGIRLAAILHALLPSESRRRDELTTTMRRISKASQITLLDEVDSPGLPVELGFHPGASPNLAFATEAMTAEELLAQLDTEVSVEVRRSHRLRLAHLGGTLAEAYLTQGLKQATDTGDTLEFISALAILGTLSARDALMAKLREIRSADIDHRYELTEQLLESLRGLPLDATDAGYLLDIARDESDPSLRVSAVRALSNCQDDRTLLRLTDLIQLSEPNIDVRRYAIETLGKAQAFYGVRQLLHEGLKAREDERERRLAWEYVVASMATVRSDPISKMSSANHKVEPTLVAFLRWEIHDPVHPLVASQCRLLTDNKVVAEALMDLAVSRKIPVVSRIAACDALSSMELVEGLKEQLNRLMCRAQKATDEPEFAAAIARTLAAHSPASLVNDKRLVCQNALWRAAFDRGLLVFDDEIAAQPALPARAAGAFSMNRPEFEHSLRTVFHEEFQAIVLKYLRIIHPNAQDVVLKHGDGGKDIVVYGIGRVYACYAPARIEDWKESDVITKIDSDLNKAKADLDSALKEWIFIHNHPQNALSNKISSHVLMLRNSNPSIKRFEVWGVEHLWEQLHRPQ